MGTRVNDALFYIPRLTYMTTNQIACYKKVAKGHPGDDLPYQGGHLSCMSPIYPGHNLI